MAGYWIISGEQVKDQSAFQKYSDLWINIAQKFDAEFVSGPDQFCTKEGSTIDRLLLIKFPTYEAAVSCYESSEYQAALKYAHKSAVRDFHIAKVIE